MFKILFTTVLLITFAAFCCEASWYGCASYEREEIENMNLVEINELRKKYVVLAEKIYEDAAVQSVLDKRLSEFRYIQYRECVAEIMVIDAVIRRKILSQTSGGLR